MALKAAFTYTGGADKGLTPDKLYPAFEIGGQLQTVDDDGQIRAIGSNCWRLENLEIDGEDIFTREEEKKDDGEGKEGVTGRVGTEGGNAAPAEKADSGAGTGQENSQGSANPQ